MKSSKYSYLARTQAWSWRRL